MADDPAITPETYATIALAEKAITDAGYQRDAQRHIWASGNNTAKVVRTVDWLNNFKFSVQWA